MVANLEFLKKKEFIKEYDELMRKPVYKLGEEKPYIYCVEEADGTILCDKGTADRPEHIHVHPSELYLHCLRKDENPVNFELVSDMPFMPKGRVNKVVQREIGDQVIWGVNLMELGVFVEMEILLQNPTIFKPLYKKKRT